MALYDDTDPELEMTDEERNLLAQAEGAGTTGASVGGVVGTGAGALIGGLLGNIPGAGIGAGLGGGLGSAAGGLIGNWIGGESAKKYEDMRAARLKPAEDRARKMQRTNELLGAWLRTPGM
jgi:uncharacterized protein YcfJ